MTLGGLGSGGSACQLVHCETDTATGTMDFSSTRPQSATTRGRWAMCWSGCDPLLLPSSAAAWHHPPVVCSQR
jgi:hypothetical protein